MVILQVPISSEVQQKLALGAKVAGVDVPTYAAEVLKRGVGASSFMKEISGPIADEFEKSCMSEEELVELLEREKHAMRAERRAAKGL